METSSTATSKHFLNSSASGYTTAVVGKWHLGTHMSPQGYDYSEVLIGQGPYYNPPMRLDEDGNGKHDKVIKHIGYTTDVITIWPSNG